MKAPDKIYLWENPIINGRYDPAWHKSSFDNTDIQYLRKDSLIALIKEMCDDAGSRDELYEKDAIIEYDAYQRVLDKINEI